MATTILTDAIEPSVFAPYVQELSLEKSLLIKSGIVQRNAELDTFLVGGGQIIEMPRWEDLSDINEANVSSTDATPAVIDSVGSVQENGVRHNRNKVFGARDLVAALAGSNPMDVIANRFASWWERHDQRLLLDIVAGIMLEDADTADGADLVNLVGVDGSVAAAENKFSANNLLDTFQLLGDGKNDIAAIACHSYIHTEMIKQDLIDFRPDSEANIGFGTYMGKTLLVDDGLTVDTTTDDGASPPNSQPLYDTLCFAPGAFQLGIGSPGVPVEVDRDALSGLGGGEEFIVSRREFVLHPVGFSYQTAAAGNGASPTNTALALTGAYDRTEAPLVSRQRAQRMVTLRSN